MLIGFMGAGKSSVGRQIATRLTVPFVDADTAIEQRAGRSIVEVFATDGEPAFRDLEQQVIADLLREADGRGGVIALGGGAAMHPLTRRRLGDALVVHLAVSLSRALARVGGDPSRPMLRRDDLADLHAQRAAVHDELADVTVDTERGSVAEIVDAVMRALNATCGSRS